tara:strand:- start:53 stop:577 length:525 start_codon:yes stop_codon:yes gene_type:complete
MSQQRGVFGTTYEMTFDAGQDAIIRGTAYEISTRATLTTSSDILEIGFTIPTSVAAYVVIEATASTIATLTVIEQVTSLVIAAGAVAVAYNQNRNSASVSGITPKFTGKTGAAFTYSGGTVISTRQLGANSPGGDAQALPGIVLKSGASTVIRLASGANTCDAALVLRWCEDPR